MKKQKILGFTAAIRKIAVLLAIPFFFTTNAEACDWCNNQFFHELNSSRQSTLVAKELLASIGAQHDFDQLRVSDSWTIEFRVPPDEGAYLMLTHAVGSASRGAIGILMAHGEKYSFTFSEVGVYDYMCTSHPYMRGQIRVSEPTVLASTGAGAPAYVSGISVIALAVALFGTLVALVNMVKKKE